MNVNIKAGLVTAAVLGLVATGVAYPKFAMGFAAGFFISIMFLVFRAWLDDENDYQP